MIFGNNTTTLNSVSVPMAEGYENYGIELSLVESARNEFAMFKAMIEADYKEMSICKESTGVVMEGEVAALHEAVGGGIFKKIAELFKKLAAKIKAIFHNFVARIRGLLSKDKDLVKRYGKELQNKRGLDKLEVKFWEKKDAKVDLFKATFDELKTKFDPKDALASYKDDNWERVQKYLNSDYSSADNIEEYKKEFIKGVLGDEETVELKSIGGYLFLTQFLNNYDKNITDMEKSVKNTTAALEKLVTYYEKESNAIAGAATNSKDAYKSQDGTEKKIENAETDTANARKQYEMATAYQTAKLADMNVAITVETTKYKYVKAAFMKAVTVNPKKLEESVVYADAIAEAAEDEVESVITGALSKSELEDLSAASTNVKDADVKDDPDALTYGPDCYTDNASMDDKDGEIDTEINSKEESAFFGAMFY